jgi:hypothetical protein
MYVLKNSGVYVDIELIKNPKDAYVIQRIKRHLTITTRTFDGKIKKTVAARFKKYNKIQCIKLPRFGYFELLNSKKIPALELKNCLTDGERCEFKLQGKLKKNQMTVLRYLANTVYTPENIVSGMGSCILHMGAGYGKSYLACGLINIRKRRTMIIVPTKFLLRQWHAVISAMFTDVKIGVYYGEKKTEHSENSDVIISVINSALKYPANEYKKLGLIIYDEIHLYCSKSFAKVFECAQSTTCIGLTATPDERTDQLDKIAQWWIGPVISVDNIPGWNAADIKFTSNVYRILYNGPDKYTEPEVSSAGTLSFPLMMNKITKDPYKNILIVAYAITLYNLNKNVFVFSERREHLSDLHKLLVEYTECNNLNTGTCAKRDSLNIEAPELGEISTLKGGATDEDIEDAKTLGRIVLTTYPYSKVGVSIDKMDSIILASTRKGNMTQILGRIFRIGGDSSVKRIIIDMVDNRTAFKSHFYERKKIYKTLDCIGEIIQPPVADYNSIKSVKDEVEKIQAAKIILN